MEVKYNENVPTIKRPILISLFPDEAQVLANIIMSVDWASLPIEAEDFCRLLYYHLKDHGYSGKGYKEAQAAW